MRIALKALACVAGLAVLATGCSTTYNGPISLNPHQPKQGTPVNPVGLVAYLERESTNLLQQGKLRHQSPAPDDAPRPAP